MSVLRGIDSTGRVSIPVEYRRLLEINEGDQLEIKIDGGSLRVSKFAPGCALCGSKSELHELDGEKDICKKCVTQIKRRVF